MSWQLHEAGIQLIDYEKKFANKLRLEMTARIKAIVAQENIPIKQVYASVRKQALVSEIMSTRGDAPGMTDSSFSNRSEINSLARLILASHS